MLFDDLPYATELEGVGGEIKRCCEDFVVTEILEDTADAAAQSIKEGESFHWWLRVRRRNLTTDDVRKALARRFDLSDARDVGCAGLKDKLAVATQWFSVPSYSPGRRRSLARDDILGGGELSSGQSSSSSEQGGTPEDASSHCSSFECQGERVVILAAMKRRSKLKRGMHRGNRFEIALRGCCGGGDDEAPQSSVSEPWPLLQARRIADRLAATGVPNYFGPQRFGRGASTALRGAMLLLGRKKKRFRSHNPVHAFAADAFCSMLFNIWLARRVANGTFVVGPSKDDDDDDDGAPLRGPLFGRGLDRADLADDEKRLLDEPTVPALERFPTEGGRRNARLHFAAAPTNGTPSAVDARSSGSAAPKERSRFIEISHTPDGDDRSLLFAFELENGAYATSVLREFVKRPGFCLRGSSARRAAGGRGSATAEAAPLADDGDDDEGDTC